MALTNFIMHFYRLYINLYHRPEHIFRDEHVSSQLQLICKVQDKTLFCTLDVNSKPLAIKDVKNSQTHLFII